MRLEQLLKLARNPHYKMSASELAELKRHQDDRYEVRRAASDVVRHDTTVQKHDTEPEKEDVRLPD